MKCYRMYDYKPMDTPVEKNLSLSLDMCRKTLDEKEQMFKVPYPNVVDSLMYAMLCMCPDICYAVGLVSRFQSNPIPKHWMAVKRILRHMKGISYYVMCYQGKNLHFDGYTDAD